MYDFRVFRVRTVYGVDEVHGYDIGWEGARCCVKSGVVFMDTPCELRL